MLTRSSLSPLFALDRHSRKFDGQAVMGAKVKAEDKRRPELLHEKKKENTRIRPNTRRQEGPVSQENISERLDRNILSVHTCNTHADWKKEGRKCRQPERTVTTIRLLGKAVKKRRGRGGRFRKTVGFAALYSFQLLF